MKLNKTCKLYLIVWGSLLALFNLIAFLAPGWVGEEKYTASFWIGYIFITLAFIGQLACAALSMKDADTLQKKFYGLSIVRVSFTGLIASFVIGGLCMLISPLPYWVGAIFCCIILVANIFASIKATFAVEHYNKVDEKIKVQTFFIKSLTADASTLIARAESEEIAEECRKIYEAVRYSDPMSHDALSSVESQITIRFSALTDAVVANDLAAVKTAAKELTVLITDRNNKCKLLK